MKVFALLYTICLIKIINCGNNDSEIQVDNHNNLHAEQARKNLRKVSFNDNVEIIVYGEDDIEAPPDVSTRTLDLLDPDYDIVTIEDSKNDGIEEREFTVKDDVLVDNVIIEGESLWTADDKGICTNITLLTYENTHMIALTTKSDAKFFLKWLHKVDGKWQDITLGDFLKIATALKEKAKNEQFQRK
ncbi:signal peptide-containing protein [Theileria equi strain WA]|uniref:Signal peptide-containing protein n=1 Tax=Theileria equi strain WA TaxID=1537102 RepID=L0AY40_THEEQ|nr:signal peptide-containing protein [Theileria equi strain WA]AFZ79911.1 signal peptide-containing protein [Theileria equi strain WA]|eukprot:XP_004829577.1 signal peptide-containing protein [Theileria equi strain WA]